MALPSGTYEITFALQGFKTLVRQNIVLELSQTLALNVTMQEATIEEQVTVIGESPLIDVKSTAKGQTMTKETFMALPRGRDLRLARSAPSPASRTSSITGGISVDGASGAENMFYVDGADIDRLPPGRQGPERRPRASSTRSRSRPRATTPSSAAPWAASSTSSPGRAATSSTATSMGFYENNTRLMQGYARDYLRHQPGGRLPLRVLEQRHPVFPRRPEPRRLQPLRGHLQPRRLHHQGQAVVLRLGQRRLRPDLGPARLQPPRGTVLDLPEPELRLQRVRQADRRPLRQPARVGQLPQQLHQVPRDPPQP
ncbi:MAG: carboxypeptidase-like regulatory domain-containing protein, partial [Desulfosudis oleivorans]|nr:carboxypeptidase-like regulatory domain-containing protein [Desulfosudis oleivorans]